MDILPEMHTNMPKIKTLYIKLEVQSPIYLALNYGYKVTTLPQ